MDFLDPADVAPHPLAALQPELRALLGMRLERMGALVDELSARGFGFVTLAEAARSFAA